MKNILDYIPTELKKQASTNGGEYAGPCPFCGGNDRFRIWPEEGNSGRYWCRQCESKGDAIQLLRDLHKMTFQEAKEALDLPSVSYRDQGRYKATSRRGESIKSKILTSPNPHWQERAFTIAKECTGRLWSPEGKKALDWLRSRGLIDEAINAASLGYNPSDIYEAHNVWGFETGKQIWIPRGITIPWIIDGEMWRLNVRRPIGRPKYIGPRGSSNGLYLMDKIEKGLPVVMAEGEFDAWSAWQSAPNLVRAVATGSTSGGQRPKWIVRLLQAPLVLVAFDTDEAGEKASRKWTELLPNAIRWAPYWTDINHMLQDGCNLRRWIESGIKAGANQINVAA